MSSFPTHSDNIKELEEMGFDVSDSLDENGKVTLESWGYDELVYTMMDIVNQLKRDGYTVNKGGQHDS